MTGLKVLCTAPIDGGKREWCMTFRERLVGRWNESPRYRPEAHIYAIDTKGRQTSTHATIVIKPTVEEAIAAWEALGENPDPGPVELVMEKVPMGEVFR